MPAAAEVAVVAPKLKAMQGVNSHTRRPPAAAVHRRLPIRVFKSVLATKRRVNGEEPVTSTVLIW